MVSALIPEREKRYTVPLSSSSTASTTGVVTFVSTSLSFLLSSFSGLGYELITPVYIELEHHDGKWTAISSKVSAYGIGSSPGWAVRNFYNMMVDFLEDLESTEDVLSPHLAQELFTLRRLIAPQET